MKKFVHEKDEADRTVEVLYNLMIKERSLEMIGSHDHRIPGRYMLAPACYQ